MLRKAAGKASEWDLPPPGPTEPRALRLSPAGQVVLAQVRAAARK